MCKAGGCSTRDKKLVLDANWRWIHTTQGYTNCYTGRWVALTEFNLNHGRRKFMGPMHISIVR